MSYDFVVIAEDEDDVSAIMHDVHYFTVNVEDVHDPSGSVADVHNFTESAEDAYNLAAITYFV